MNKDKLSPYGYDNRPPFTLYQGDDGKWGLIDADGIMLPAVFIRSDDGEVFSSEPWEVMSFSEKVGFELLAWFDPDEVWFNFTFNNPDYPDRWGKLLWEKINGKFESYKTDFQSLLPEKDRWIIEVTASWETAEEDIRKRWGYDDRGDEEEKEFLMRLNDDHPQLFDFKSSNLLLEPILDGDELPENVKAILWNSKVGLDFNIRDYLELDNNG